MIKTTTTAATRSSELAAVLEHQAAVRAAQAAIDKFQRAIAECEQNLEHARTRRPSDELLARELENLRAAVALGEVTETEMRRREEKIASERASLAKAAGDVDGTISELELTRSGLQRRLEAAHTSLEISMTRKPEVLRAFLVSEAEAVCADYVEAGRKVKAAWLQLSALEWMLHSRTRFKNSILGHQVRLPVVNLPQCEGLGTEMRTKGMMWFDPESVVMGPTINESKEQELARLRALGVALD
jgi:chromosome segregation ATPase